MTLQALPRQPTIWIPTAGYHLAALAELRGQASTLRVMVEACDDYWKEFWEKCDAEMLGQQPKPNPQQRLAIYQNKPTMPPPPPPVVVDPATGQPIPQPQQPMPASWHEQRNRIPRDFQAAMADWVQLEPVSVRRNQVMRELAIQDALEAGQSAMSNPPALKPPPPPFSAPNQPPPPLQWPKAGP